MPSTSSLAQLEEDVATLIARLETRGLGDVGAAVLALRLIEEMHGCCARVVGAEGAMRMVERAVRATEDAFQGATRRRQTRAVAGKKGGLRAI